MKKSAKKGYLGNPNLKRAHDVHEFTQYEIEEYVKCSKDPVYFIEKYVYILNLDKGEILFKLYDFQHGLVDTLINNRFAIIKCPRQCGKSQTTAAYFVWKIVFQANQKIAILANKASGAREILNRIKYSYERLPKFLQQGVVEWNKGNIKLENESEIKADSTSGNALRGFSVNVLMLDEFAFVPRNLADEFYESVYPTLSSSKTSQLFMISTPKGINNLFYKTWCDSKSKKNDYKSFEINWYDVPGRDEQFKINTIKNIGLLKWQQEFEAQFLGSSNTLIDPKFLGELVTIDPIKEINGLKIYKDPVIETIQRADKTYKQAKHKYIAIVDTAEGTQNDYSVCGIIDISVSPYEVVAIYRNNKIAPADYSAKLIEIFKYYYNCYCLVEINSVGNQVADDLASDFEYENILYSFGTAEGAKLSGGFKKNVKKGVRTTTKTKSVGCSQLKRLIENNQIIINDSDIYSELTTFVKIKNSYGAESGANDDLVMCLVLFAWLTTQDYFKELTDTGLMKRAKDTNNSRMSENMIPFGLIEDGFSEEGFDEFNDDIDDEYDEDEGFY